MGYLITYPVFNFQPVNLAIELLLHFKNTFENILELELFTFTQAVYLHRYFTSTSVKIFI